LSTDRGINAMIVVGTLGSRVTTLVNIPVRRSRSSGETETACPELGTAIK
jgi:hypothetical protein